MGAHSFKFNYDTELLLRAFCEASNDASMQTVVTRALKQFIAKELDENSGIRDRFDEIRRKRTGK